MSNCAALTQSGFMPLNHLFTVYISLSSDSVVKSQLKISVLYSCSVLLLKEMVEAVQAQPMSAGGMQKSLAI